jgi:hypothetical protein
MIGSVNPKELPPCWLRVTGQVVDANVEGTRSTAVLALPQNFGARSSIVHLERELDFTLVELTLKQAQLSAGTNTVTACVLQKHTSCHRICHIQDKFILELPSLRYL